MRWYDEMAPSPVLWRHPASAAPRLMASTALPDRDPKLMPDTLTTDSGRNECFRPRAAPSTFAEGSRASWPTAPWVGWARPNVRWWTMTLPDECSRSLSVPNPK